jgi:hypothetical protein
MDPLFHAREHDLDRQSAAPRGDRMSRRESACSPSRYFTAAQQPHRFWGKANIDFKHLVCFRVQVNVESSLTKLLDALVLS